jgi:predicted TPR repeat methyltransferase
VQDRGLLGRLLHAAMPRLDIRFLSRVGTGPETRILDVGCGSGKLLRTLHSIGYRQLTGIDPFVADDIEIGPGARILKSTIETFEQPQDLIMFNHSLEHVPDQEGTLRRAARLLADGGAITVSIPVVSSEAWRTYGVDWVQLDAPRHLYLHSARSIELVARRTGLRVVEVFQDSNAFQFWGSEQCRRGIALNAPNSYLVDPARSVFSREDIARFRREAQRVNAAGCGDQATFILRPCR